MLSSARTHQKGASDPVTDHHVVEMVTSDDPLDTMQKLREGKLLGVSVGDCPDHFLWVGPA